MSKKYINAELQIVRMNSNDIVTTSIPVGTPISSGNVSADAPGRRRDIWN